MSDENSNNKTGRGANRRRVSHIVHDERGNARVEWIDALQAGEELERTPLSVESTPSRGTPSVLAVERSRAGGFNPYQRTGTAGVPEEKRANTKRDLRALGEWIKMKRELDERRAQDDHDIE